MTETMSSSEAQALSRVEASFDALLADSRRRTAEEHAQPRAIRERRRDNLIDAYLSDVMAPPPASLRIDPL